ncbi:hypothetical protein J4E91_003064 [Alternaria rosae]|nr:hypothetical protein J4E91_003064 [Alternaria rosae]
MYLNPSILAIVLSFNGLTSAKPIDGKVHAVKRADPMSYPYGDALPNEFQWLEWDPDDEDQKKDGQKIHEASKQWVRNMTLSFVMVHEFSHYDFVAGDRTGGIIDMKNGITSVGCFNLDDEEKPNNAQSYAFNAAEQYWSDKCSDKDFTDPGVKHPDQPAPTPTPTPSPEPVAPYADQPGKCHIHVNEYKSCDSHDDNLSVEITMWDASGAQIGHVDKTKAGAGNTLMMKSKLEKTLEVTPENQHNYIQFTLGGQSWATNKDNDESAPAYCNVGDWAPRSGPCPWGGGATSDGS